MADVVASAELKSPSANDLAYWLRTAGLSTWAAVKAAADARGQPSPGELAGLPTGIALKWWTDGKRRIYRVDWSRKI